MNLTGHPIKDTYQVLVNVVGNTVTDGTGSVITSLPITASRALTASFALNASSGNSVSSSYASASLSSSHALTASAVVTPYISTQNLDVQFNITSTAASIPNIATDIVSFAFNGGIQLSPETGDDIVKISPGMLQVGTEYNDRILINDYSINMYEPVSNQTCSISITADDGILRFANGLSQGAVMDFTQGGLLSIGDSFYPFIGTNRLQVNGNISASAVTASRFFGAIQAGLGVATGINAVAIGGASRATGDESIAMGANSLSSAPWAVSEGINTTASGFGSHASGQETKALGTGAFTAGFGTIASGSNQVVVGKNNAQGNSTALFIVGNGATTSSRSDAFIVTTTGITAGVPITGSISSAASASFVVSSSYAVTASYFTINDFLEQSVGRARVMNELYTSSYAFNDGTPLKPFTLRALFIGDSLTDGARYSIVNAFRDKFVSIQGVGPYGTLVGGNAATVTGAHTTWPNGIYINLTSGSTFEPMVDSVTPLEANSCKVYYIKEPGAGTANVEHNVSGETAYRLLGTLSASAGTITGSVASFNYFHNLGSVRITGTTGSIKIIGVKYLLAGQPGVQLTSIAVGGLDILNMVSCSNAILQPILSDINPHIIFYFGAEDESRFKIQLPILYSQFNTAIGLTPDWVFCGRPSTGSANILERDTLRMFAISSSQAFLDFGPKLTGVMVSDAVHPNDQGWVAVGHAMANCAPIPPYTRQFGKNYDDNSTVTRGTFPQMSLWNVGRLFPLVPGSYGSSGTGASAGASQNCGWAGYLASGTGASSYGMSTLMTGLNTIPARSGNGINTNIITRFGLRFTIYSATSSCARFVIGGKGVANGAPPAANADALSTAGWGIEFRHSSSNFVGKLFCHNGTSYTTSSWFVIRTSAASYEVPYSCIIEKSGSNVFGYFTTPGSPTMNRYPQLFISTSLNGSTPAGNASIDAICVNDSLGSIASTEWILQNIQMEQVT